MMSSLKYRMRVSLLLVRPLFWILVCPFIHLFVLWQGHSSFCVLPVRAKENRQKETHSKSSSQPLTSQRKTVVSRITFIRSQNGQQLA